MSQPPPIGEAPWQPTMPGFTGNQPVPSAGRRAPKPSVFPPGKFFAPRLADGRVIVQPPYQVDGVPDQLRQFETELGELRDWRAAHPADVPRPVFPEPDGMIPWARSSRECLLWARDCPDRWTVVISNGGIWRYDRDSAVLEGFDVGAVDFLIGMVTGQMTSQVLNPARQSGAPRSCL